ncbi:MAG: outer membrane beta-barrel protein [Algoriphagus sp.]|uniref:DUF3575 domain-containing protein n=1 Tax=Algoriphagus sp. TaxID=1872435 RepID=UPI00272F5ACA|nr:DUF3575 domain-containing protein [Algoriphagus sp.]MDP2041492.1 outer membrane beta-barrel protein [Algoriphagus sp.]MDP3472523.1 outer membrane beta-barrel protein [Algoriphagus sp.]
MKKITLSAFFVMVLAVSAFSQQVISSSGNSNPYLRNFENEVKFNFLNLILLSSFEVGYERFLSENHSLDIQLHLNDRFGYNLETDGKKFKTNSIQAAMNFYFGNNPNGRFHAYPLLKLRFGDYEEPIMGGISSTDMTAFILGAGAGYKWEVSEHFAFGPYASLARNFSDQVSSKFTGIELNAGFSLGYRF